MGGWMGGWVGGWVGMWVHVHPLPHPLPHPHFPQDFHYFHSKKLINVGWVRGCLDGLVGEWVVTWVGGWMGVLNCWQSLICENEKQL